MMKLNKNASLTLSLVLSWLFLGGLVAGGFLLPMIFSYFAEKGYFSEAPGDRAVALILLYAALAVAFGAILVLLRLLRTVRRSEVFGEGSARCLRILSYACFGEAILFAALMFVRFLEPLTRLGSLLICVAALFLGLLLRVVKHVIVEATRIKSENDFTI